MATGLVTCPDAIEEPAWRLEAALVIDPDSWNKGPLRVATSAMTARKDRIFFIDTPFSACLPVKQVMLFHISLPLQGGVLAIEWAHRDLITGEVYRE